MDVTLGVRALHVISAAVAVGIPVALALVMYARPEPAVVERLVTPAERTQWVALGVLVASGVGNLAAFEGNFPGAGWPAVLFTKLGFVFALLIVSAVRTFFIAGLGRPHRVQRVGAQRVGVQELGVQRLGIQRLGVQRPGIQRLGAWYGVTAVLGVVIVGLAEVLAHG